MRRDDADGSRRRAHEDSPYGAGKYAGWLVGLVLAAMQLIANGSGGAAEARFLRAPAE
jgi:hypothetical protein